MKIIDSLVDFFISIKYKPVDKMLRLPLRSQKNIMIKLIKDAEDTIFGSDHSFKHIKDYETFKANIPLRNYEAFLPYIKKIKNGEKDVLWPGVPVFFGTSAGTTSKVKYIPVTKASLKNQIGAPQYFALNYSYCYKNTSFLKGKVLLFSDGHTFENVGGIKAAPISTIVHSCIPKIYSLRCLPSDEVNAISDFDKRILAMIKATLGKDIRVIVAMPIWLLTYLRALKKLTGKSFKEHFPNFQLLMSSGMDFKPFLPEIHQYISPPFDIIESYPSTEGFIAYQDRIEERGMQLILDNGIFYEFVPAEEIHLEKPTRVSLDSVKTGKNYALVLNTNAGLWGYINGDTVRFKTLFPHRIEITGRISQFISAFGEHVTVEETDNSISETAEASGATIVNYTVAPHFDKNGSLPYHEWFIEFGISPKDLDGFAELLDQKLGDYNFTYKKTVERKAIAPLKITLIPPNGFEDFMRKVGKTGLQQKIPHASNDYKFAQHLKDLLDLKDD